MVNSDLLILDASEALDEITEDVAEIKDRARAMTCSLEEGKGLSEIYRVRVSG